MIGWMVMHPIWLMQEGVSLERLGRMNVLDFYVAVDSATE